MMKTWTIKLALAISFAMLVLSTNANAQDNDGCSDATLKGDYAFTVNGTIWVGPNNSIPVLRGGIAMTHFNGMGGLSQVDFVLSGANAPAPTGALLVPPTDKTTGFHNDETGTYTVYPDCTGTFTINDPDFVGTDIPGPVITVNFVLSDGGRSIHTVVTSLVAPGPKGPAEVPALIQSEGRKLGRLESW